MSDLSMPTSSKQQLLDAVARAHADRRRQKLLVRAQIQAMCEATRTQLDVLEALADVIGALGAEDLAQQWSTGHTTGLHDAATAVLDEVVSITKAVAATVPPVKAELGIK